MDLKTSVTKIPEGQASTSVAADLVGSGRKVSAFCYPVQECDVLFHACSQITEHDGQYFIAATLLMNCHTCLYGSVTNSYFGCEPPTLTQYLA